MILFKTDYFVYEFLQNRSGIFDFREEDSALGITLEDPAFVKDGEVFLLTVTHEKICIAAEDVCREL